jgi:hypothetical protein
MPNFQHIYEVLRTEMASVLGVSITRLVLADQSHVLESATSLGPVHPE